MTKEARQDVAGAVLRVLNRLDAAGIPFTLVGSVAALQNATLQAQTEFAALFGV